LEVQLGAEVTAVTSTRNLELVRSLGASHVVDYTTQRVEELAGTYDVIADTVAASSFKNCLPLLNERGGYLAIAGGLPDMLARRSGTRRSISGVAPERAEDLATLLGLADEGQVRPVIDRVLDWHELPDAHAHVETGRKRGSVVVRTPRA
jgi:NADPH:quinone reductase-like Zn-dependent oxidoreductase